MIRVYDYQEGQIELPIYDASSMTAGQGLKWGVDGSAVGITALIDVATDCTDIFATLQDAPATTTTNQQTPIIYKGRVVMVENPKVYKAYWDLSTSTDLDATGSSDTTQITHATDDDNLDGGWVYLNSGTGAGQLRYAKGANTTTKTVNTAFTTAPDATTDFIYIRPQGIPTGGNVMNATFDMLLAQLNGSDTTQILVLKNFMEGAGGSWELDITENPQVEMDNLNARGVRFYSHLIFVDTHFSAAGV